MSIGSHPDLSWVPNHGVTSLPAKEFTSAIPSKSITGTSTGPAPATTLQVVRCKSPILEWNDEHMMKAKRPRKMSSGESNTSMDHPTARHRTFIPIHAAFECQASYHIIERVLTERPYDVHRFDDMDRNVLHFAVAHCHDRAIVELILEPNHHILTSKSVRVVDRTTGRLPLHIAIANTADARVIQALLHHYPQSGITPCRTPDEFYDKSPIQMATHYNCDVSTVYELLRIDPSFVLRNQW
jgi:hypothetical protein